MNKIINVMKVLLNTFMTVIIIIGIIFIVLYLIGIEPFVVQSGSMEPAIETGSLSFINKRFKYEKIKENDIIAFETETGVKVTHRAIAINDKGIETKGDANDVSDGISTTKENYIGKNIFSIPKLGYAVKIIQSTRGKIIFGTFIVVLLASAFLIGEPSKNKEAK